MPSPRTEARRGRVVDAALWSTTTGLALLTLLFSFGLRAPRTGAFPISDRFGHGAMYFGSPAG